jgi:hypothetical protein
MSFFEVRTLQCGTKIEFKHPEMVPVKTRSVLFAYRVANLHLLVGRERSSLPDGCRSTRPPALFQWTPEDLRRDLSEATAREIMV